MSRSVWPVSGAVQFVGMLAFAGYQGRVRPNIAPHTIVGCIPHGGVNGARKGADTGGCEVVEPILYHIYVSEKAWHLFVAGKMAVRAASYTGDRHLRHS